MNDKELDRHLKARRERWRPYNEWKDKIDERVLRLDVRTKLALAKATYLKALTEMRAWQGAAAGRQGEMATSAMPDASEESGRRGKGRRSGKRGATNE